MIKPTIGRVVWVHRPQSIDQTQPEVGFITFVHQDDLINVAGFNANGEVFCHTSIYLHNPPEGGDHARPEWARNYWTEWMPYQKGQAAKTEALEKQIGAGG